jgi:cytochrome b561
MLKKLSQLKQHHQIMWSVGITVAIVALWRGVWMLFDVYMFPSMPVLSAFTSIVIGITMIAVTQYRLK